MLIDDRLYGQIEITEPVILELLQSPALTRLKGVDQGGYTKVFFSYDNVSRLEHSIGVYWILKEHGAQLAETVAGLIHDVSHSAFSHTIDYVLGGDGGKQDHQDRIFSSFIKKTEIPSILEKYGLDTEYVINDSNFPLKESELPGICADRLDYSLRTAVAIKAISQNEARALMEDLVVKDNHWAFATQEAAEKYAQLFLQLNDNYWASTISGVMHLTAGDYLGYALEKGYIQEADLYTTDKEVLEKISHYLHSDEKLNFFWKRMNNNSVFSEDQTPLSRTVSLKSRVVDPYFLSQENLIRLSDAQPIWRQKVIDGLKPKIKNIIFKD